MEDHRKHSAIYDSLKQEEKDIVDAIAAFIDNIDKYKRKTILAAVSWELRVKDSQDHQ